jgi:hypothetical protein
MCRTRDRMVSSRRLPVTFNFLCCCNRNFINSPPPPNVFNHCCTHLRCLSRGQ